MSADELELYKKHRPTTFKQMVGQSQAVAMLLGMVRGNNLPHSILFSGPSGCGKTTLARILRTKLQCDEVDYREVNSSDDRGIDGIRRLRDQIRLAPIGGACRIILLDEAHQITGDAQEALLKILEDTPRHVYLFLCTTEPDKLKTAIRTRCTEVNLVAVGDEDLAALLKQVSEEEQLTVPESVIEAIVATADGSPRKALVLLQQAGALSEEVDQLNVVRNSGCKETAQHLGRLLTNVRAPLSWPDIAAALKEVKWNQAEGVRRMLLGYARAVLLNQKGPNPIAYRCFTIIQVFRGNVFDSGDAGLTGDCWDVYMESMKK